MRDLDSLRQLLRRPDTLLFVGSGASRWSGLPDWERLLEGFCDQLDRLGRNSDVARRELGGGDLLLAASYVFDQLTPEERRAHLRAQFVREDAGPSELHRAIVQLGPTCFITTNYDTLIEQTLAAERPGEYFDVVTPAHRLEIPSIVSARANHFVFKPHGDIGNSDTIVLTREDYRTLQTERRNVFDAAKTLMASRPVVFIGFGLRDPDFLLMRDQLLGTYSSNPADHLAIMSDVHESEVQYWRRNYGIDLISYITDAGANNPHQQLLELVRSLGKATPRSKAEDPAPISLSEPRIVLSLARYARGLTERFAASPHGFPLQFSASPTDGRVVARALPSWRLTVSDALTTLVDYRGNLLIEGPPGSGKSFLTTSVARHLAVELEAACLADGDAHFTTPVPVFVPLRDYRGNLSEMIESILPVDLPLARLLEGGSAYLILDGVNEIEPRHEAAFAQDLSDLPRFQSMTVTVTTRFAAAIEATEFTTVRLDAVTSQYVDSALSELAIDPDDVNPETRELLRRPLFFNAWKRGSIDLAQTATVHDIYSQLASHHQDAVRTRFNIEVSLQDLLGRVAYAMVDGGELSASLADVLVGLSKNLPDGILGQDMLNFLLESGVLVATPLKRLTFYHHSVTEYLAGSHLASLIENDNTVATQCLGRVDWDQSLLLSLGFMSDALAAQTQDTIMRVDTVMGLRTLHFVEQDRAEWISRALSLIPEELSMDSDTEIADALESLTFSEAHVVPLQALSLRPDYVGGTAAAKLYLLDPQRLGGLLEKIVYGREDFNYLNRVAALIKDHVDEAAALGCLDMLEQREYEQELVSPGTRGADESFVAETVALAEILKARVSVEKCVERARNSDSELVRRVVARRVDNSLRPAAIEYIRELIVAGSENAIFEHYMQVGYLPTEDSPQIPAPSVELVDVLVSKLRVDEVSHWSISLLRALTTLAPETAGMVARHDGEGLYSAILKYVVGDTAGFEMDLLGLVASDIDWDQEPTFALQHVKGLSPDVVHNLLSTRHDGLAAAVLESLVYPHGSGLDLNLAAEIDSYLDWLDRLSKTSSRSFEALRLAEFLCEQTDDTTRGALLSKFNSEPAIRPLVDAWILPRLGGLSMDDLSQGSIEWLLSRAGQFHNNFHDPDTLELIATEDMVSEALLPKFLTEENEAVRARLADMLRSIGRRHNRRYIGDDDLAVA